MYWVRMQKLFQVVGFVLGLGGFGFGLGFGVGFGFGF